MTFRGPEIEIFMREETVSHHWLAGAGWLAHSVTFPRKRASKKFANIETESDCSVCY